MPPCRISRRRVVLGGLGAMLVPLYGCGGGAGEAALFAPFFVFAFEGVVDRRLVDVSFAPDSTSGTTSGRFDPANSVINMSDANGGNFFSSSFSGSFQERSMHIVLQTAQAPLVSEYDGVFTAQDTIVLTPSGAAGASITVRRNENDSFLPRLTGDWSGQDAAGAAWLLRLATEPPGSDEATVLLTGSEMPGTAAEAPLTGYASIRYIELTITRAGGVQVRLTGVLEPTGKPPPPGEPQITETIRFDGGGSLTRVL
jgi:hypothetical protein